jgi:ribosomal protein L37AE/L43A
MGRDSRVWSFAIASDPTYGGNTGYADDPTTVYRYDSLVQYHAQVNSGDIAIVVVDEEATGAARIERIRASAGTKTLQRCPGCKTTNLARRRTISPPYRCNSCGETFTHPKHDEVEVTTFEAELGAWHPLRNISRQHVRDVAAAKGQTAIRPLNVEEARRLLSSQAPGAAELLR